MAKGFTLEITHLSEDVEKSYPGNFSSNPLIQTKDKNRARIVKTIKVAQMLSKMIKDGDPSVKSIKVLSV